MEASAVRAAVVTCALAVALALRPSVVRGQREPDFDRMLQQQAETNKTWRAASDGFMQMDKISYRTFDRRVDPKTWQPENTREQRDSWNRVWTFLDWNLDPFHAELRPSTR